MALPPPSAGPQARFTKHVFPGDRLQVRMWREDLTQHQGRGRIPTDENSGSSFPPAAASSAAPGPPLGVAITRIIFETVVVGRKSQGHPGAESAASSPSTGTSTAAETCVTVISGAAVEFRTISPHHHQSGNHQSSPGSALSRL